MRERSRFSNPRRFHSNTNRRMYRFASSGEMGEPCGIPRPLSLASVVRVFRSRSSVSSTAHSSHILIRCSTRESTMRRASERMSSGCECWGSSPRSRRQRRPDGLRTWSLARRSPPAGHCGPRDRRTVRREDRPRRFGSSTSIAAVMQTRSRTVDIPNGLGLPLGLGMSTRLIGAG